MKKSNIVLIGAGGHARSCIEVIEVEGKFSIVGLVGQKAEVGVEVLGYRVIASDDEMPNLAQDISYALVAIGQVPNPTRRIAAHDNAVRAGFIMASVISPRAHVSRYAQLGAGTIVMHGATINASAKIGKNCIINSHALIEHDVMVADHCHVSTSVTINGSATIGLGSFIGSQSVIREGIDLPDYSLVRMGSSVFDSLEMVEKTIDRS